MASWKWPAVLNKMLEDIPGINTLLNALLKQDPAGTTDVPAGAKRWADTADGKQLQVWNGSSWSSVGKLDHDAASVDGHSASTGTTANTIPVRDADGKLPGDILGNAATASEAAALSEVNPIEMGGTGGSTAAKARENLVVPPKNHASASTDYGLGTSSQYGHTKPHDAPDATLTADAGHAFSPAGAASLKTDLEGQIEDVETGASQQVSALDSTLRALIASEVAKYLPLSGGTMTGSIRAPSGGSLSGETGELSTVLFSRHGDYEKPCIVLWRKDGGEKALIRAQNKNATNDFWLYPDGTALLGGHSVLTSAGGNVDILHLGANAYVYGFAAQDTSGRPVYEAKYGFDNGATLILRREDSTGYDQAGMAGLLARANGQTTRFMVYPDGSADLNGSPVLTSASGLLLNSGNVQLFSCPTGGGWTAPAGGTWAYFICGEYNAQNIYGTVAGGTYVAWPNGGHPAQGIAFRIAS